MLVRSAMHLKLRIYLPVLINAPVNYSSGYNFNFYHVYEGDVDL